MKHSITLAAAALVTMSALPRGAPVVAVPSISTLSPTSAFIGTSTLSLTVNGANFVRTSVVRWSGSDRPTTYVSATQLRATIAAADLATLGAPQVTVFTQGGNGGTSNSAPFTVGNPVPVITSTLPTDSVFFLGPQFGLQIDGSGFAPGASVRVNSSVRAATYFGPTRVSLTIPATDIDTAGTLQVAVFNPAPLGGLSPPKTIRIVVKTPSITALTPATQAVGQGRGFVLRVDGFNFLTTSVVRWNGQNRVTTVVNTGQFAQLSAVIPDSDVDSSGSANVTVQVTAPGAPPREGPPKALLLPNPAPTFSSVNSPTTGLLLLGGAPKLVTIFGNGLGHFSTVTFNGRPVATRAISYGRLEATLVAQSPDTVGPATLKIVNPPPGGGTATGFATVIDNPPVLSSVAPQNVYRGGAAFTLTVKGMRFYPGMTVHWNGSGRTTTYVSHTELRAAIPASDITLVGSGVVKVWDPTSGFTGTLNVGILDQMIIIK